MGIVKFVSRSLTGVRILLKKFKKHNKNDVELVRESEKKNVNRVQNKEDPFFEDLKNIYKNLKCSTATGDERIEAVDEANKLEHELFALCERSQEIIKYVYKNTNYSSRQLKLLKQLTNKHPHRIITDQHFPKIASELQLSELQIRAWLYQSHHDECKH